VRGAPANARKRYCVTFRADAPAKLRHFVTRSVTGDAPRRTHRAASRHIVPRRIAWRRVLKSRS
jgi:hypothetical protein